MSLRPLAGRHAVLGCLLLLGASLAGNAYLVHEANGYYRAASALRLDPVGLRVFAQDRAKPVPSDRPILVLFGDSRAQMWSPLPDLGEYRIVNRGIGHQTTAQILLRFDVDVAPLHPAVVVLEAGVNDLKAISEFPALRGEIVAACEDNLRVVVERCRALGASVVLASVFPIGDVPLWRRPFWSSDVDGAVNEVNAFLAGLAREREKVVLFDADPVLDDERGRIQRRYQLDFLHLLPAGYSALNANLSPLVHGLAR